MHRSFIDVGRLRKTHKSSYESFLKLNLLKPSVVHCRVARGGGLYNAPGFQVP